MVAALRGELPPHQEVVPSSDLWREERRVGIERCRNTRTVREGALYSARHVRLAPGVTIGVRVSGVPASWRLPLGQMVPLGGESRVAECRQWDSDPTLHIPLEEIESSGRMTVVALTPLDVGDAYREGVRLSTFSDATIVAACLARAGRIGGWRTVPRPGPLPLRSVLPSGSTIFCRVADPPRLREVIDATRGSLRVGARQPWGFGAVALGTWPGSMEVTA
jgi:CRISPR-associated protein Cmr3